MSMRDHFPSQGERWMLALLRYLSVECFYD